MKAEMEWREEAKALSERNAERMKSRPSLLSLRLTIELVPKGSWRRDLAKMAPRTE